MTDLGNLQRETFHQVRHGWCLCLCQIGEERKFCPSRLSVEVDEEFLAHLDRWCGHSGCFGFDHHRFDNCLFPFESEPLHTSERSIDTYETFVLLPHLIFSQRLNLFGFFNSCENKSIKIGTVVRGLFQGRFSSKVEEYGKTNLSLSDR